MATLTRSCADTTQRLAQQELKYHQSRKRNGHGYPNVGEIERWVSGAAGAGLVAYGLKKRGLTGLAMGLVGGALVKRGLTGQCELYRAMGVNTAAPAYGNNVYDEPTAERRKIEFDEADEKDVVEEQLEESFPASDAPSGNIRA